MHRAAALLALASLIAGVSAGQDADQEITERIRQNIEDLLEPGRLDEFLDKFAEDQERLQLFNSCRPMFFLVEGLNDDTEGIGLTREALLAAAESRLRAARLYPNGLVDMAEAVTAQLVADIHVVGPAVHVSLAYRKKVTDEFGTAAFADTWSLGVTGTHGRNAQSVVSGLSPLLDKFLAEYLRINAEACAAR